jgi:hypothetical protein
MIAPLDHWMYITHMHSKCLSSRDLVTAVWLTVVVVAQGQLLCVAFDAEAIAMCVTSCVVASDSCVVDADEEVIVLHVTACVQASDSCVVATTVEGVIMCAWPLVLLRATVVWSPLFMGSSSAA